MKKKFSKTLVGETFSAIHKEFAGGILTGCIAIIWFPVAALIGTMARPLMWIYNLTSMYIGFSCLEWRDITSDHPRGCASAFALATGAFAAAIMFGLDKPFLISLVAALFGTIIIAVVALAVSFLVLDLLLSAVPKYE